MVQHFFPRFLEDRKDYDQAVRYWAELWDGIDPRHAWKTPWVGTGSPEIRDGNPIFSAVSPRLGRGVRIIQDPPTTNQLELQHWFDTFGGDITDPDSISELVIACALSDEAAVLARSMIEAWINDGAISITWPGLPPATSKLLTRK